MERSSKRGKIPQQDWPSIIKRYEAGETLASIARTYDCSPPAISYILSRSRARDATVDGTEQSAIESSEPRLVKGHPNDMPAREFINGAPEIGEAAELPPTAQASDPMDGSNSRTGVRRTGFRVEWDGGSVGNRSGNRRDGNSGPSSPARYRRAGSSRSVRKRDSPAACAGPNPSWEPRRTLHLSLSHNDAQLMETPHHDGPVRRYADASVVRPVGDQQQGLTQHPARHHPAPNAAANNGGAARSMAESHKKDGGTFIDRALRERVDGDISAFLAAFDAALADGYDREPRRAPRGDGSLVARRCPHTYRTGASRGSRAVIGTGHKWVLGSELASALNCRPGFFT